MSAWKNLRRGLRNLWDFRREVWGFRGFDWHYSYGLFMRGLELQRKHMAKCQNHTEWERDVASLDLALARWRLFEESDDWSPEGLRLWDLLHDHLKRNARSWWD